MIARTTAGRTFGLSILSFCALLVLGVSQAFAVAPTVTTKTASGVSATEATLNGKVKTDSTLTDCHFEYVLVSAHRETGFTDLSSGGSVPCMPAAASIPLNTVTPVSAAISRSSDAALVFRLIATNATSTVTGYTVGIGFGITGFDGKALQMNGEAMTQAGGHPHRSSAVFFLTEGIADGDDLPFPIDSLEDVIVDLPPGFVGNPNGVPGCAEALLTVGEGQVICPRDSQVGMIQLFIDQPNGQNQPRIPLFNMEVPHGKAALFGFNFLGAVYHIYGNLVRDPSVAGGYRVRIFSLDAPLTMPLYGVDTEIWGVPADPSHDIDRGGVATLPRKPFVSLPTSCIGDDGQPGSPVRTEVRITGWQGGEDTASFLSHDTSLPFPNPVGHDGCNTLDFSPSLEARPTTNVADSPSGLDFNLHIPQNEDPDGVAEAHLRDTVVTLPEGMTINPSAGNGLDACTPAQIGLDNEAPANCPDAAKVGIVEVETPLLSSPVPGAAYIASPHNNPFNSLLALYFVLDDPVSGIRVKLAGEVKADPVTGQLTTTVTDNPQVPFEDFRLKLFGGAAGALKTPATCGTYATTSSFTPWSAPDSGPPATPSDVWAIEQSPTGGGCATNAADLPNSPSFDAGTVSPIAGAKTPLVVNLRRQDGTQQFRSLNITPPQGLVGKLAGIPYCSEDALATASSKSGRAEEASPSCPAASYVGSVVAAAGAGPAPYQAAGRAYLTGPYKGAPLSIAIITPATAGPFDLGTVVVKTALYVDRRTTQISAISDPLPTILQGIPLDIRSVSVRMDRPDFTINPTSCNPSTFGGQLMSVLGQTAPLQSRFQVGECGRLKFEPKLALSLKGSTKRSGNPALTAVLTVPEGSANVASISVALPHSEFLDQSHIRTVCTRVQFASDTCPEAAIYGTATVQTPLLDYPLPADVYLRSSDNPLPDLVIDMRGPAHQPIQLESSGRVDSIKGGIRNSFEFVPDAPFSKLTLQMQGGSKGLLENSTNLCLARHRATVKYTAHNGAQLTAKPLLKAQCGKKGKKKGKGKKKAGKSGKPRASRR